MGDVTRYQIKPIDGKTKVLQPDIQCIVKTVLLEVTLSKYIFLEWLLFLLYNYILLFGPGNVVLK